VGAKKVDVNAEEFRTARQRGLEPGNVCVDAVLTGEGTQKRTHAEMVEVVEAWPGLPEPLRAAVMAIVRAYRSVREG